MPGTSGPPFWSGGGGPHLEGRRPGTTPRLQARGPATPRLDSDKRIDPKECYGRRQEGLRTAGATSRSADPRTPSTLEFVGCDFASNGTFLRPRTPVDRVGGRTGTLVSEGERHGVKEGSCSPVKPGLR